MRYYRPIEFTIVDRLYGDYDSILKFLDKSGQPSLSSDAENSFRKTFLLACASYWEYKIQEIVEGFVNKYSDSNTRLVHLVKAKVISRQYHTWFDWKNGSASPFFAMFGDEYKSFCSAYAKNDSSFKSCVDAFMEIGSVRNLLVHNNFAAYPIDKTLDEIYSLYQLGMGFIDHCETTLLG